MYMMKRLLILMLVFGLVMCVCACGSANDDASTSETTLNDEKNNTTETTEKPTGETEPSEEESKPNYQVTVLDESGNPIAGVMLQMCLETCVPGKTNENGVAEFFLEEADYKVSLLNMPEGYDYSTEEQEWYFASGETTMTVVLKSVG